jgi:hypothetical protein
LMKLDFNAKHYLTGRILARSAEPALNKTDMMLNLT